MESFSSARYSKWDDDRVWSSQEWKTEIETYERSGRLDEISWRMIRKVRLGFSHGETLHDGTAQSVMNEETPRDRRETRYRFSRRGMASTTRYWEWWSRIGIVSRIKIIRESGEWSGAKKTEDFLMLLKMEKNIPWFGECSCLWRWNLQYSCERITWTIAIYCEYNSFNKCSAYLQDWCLNKMRSLDWKQLVGRIIHGNTCH